jgi:hypothetical protein
VKRRLIGGLLAVMLMASCDAGQTTKVSALGNQSTAALCSRHLVASGMELLAVEAELGARGALQCTTTYGSKSYVGARTEASVGRLLYSRATPAPLKGPDKNCSDFASAGEAQRFFLANGGPNRDPHGLDGDGDGNACEWGKTLKSSAKKFKPAPVRYAAPKRTSSRTCYTGPRGGRYYYSASGRKVYGC